MSEGWPTYKPAVSGIKPPENHVETPLFDPFEAELGPFFRKIGNESAPTDGNPVELAIFLDQRHRAADNLAAVGALMTIADATMGWVGFYLFGEQQPVVTLRLNADILNRPKTGNYLFCKTELTEQSGDALAISGHYRDGDGNLVMRTTSLWKMVGK